MSINFLKLKDMSRKYEILRDESCPKAEKRSVAGYNLLPARHIVS
jgi:hypothetical protein